MTNNVRLLLVSVLAMLATLGVSADPVDSGRWEACFPTSPETQKLLADADRSLFQRASDKQPATAALFGTESSGLNFAIELLGKRFDSTLYLDVSPISGSIVQKENILNSAMRRRLTDTPKTLVVVRGIEQLPQDKMGVLSVLLQPMDSTRPQVPAPAGSDSKPLPCAGAAFVLAIDMDAYEARVGAKPRGSWSQGFDARTFLDGLLSGMKNPEALVGRIAHHVVMPVLQPAQVEAWRHAKASSKDCGRANNWAGLMNFESNLGCLKAYFSNREALVVPRNSAAAAFVRWLFHPWSAWLVIFLGTFAFVLGVILRPPPPPVIYLGSSQVGSHKPSLAEDENPVEVRPGEFLELAANTSASESEDEDDAPVPSKPSRTTPSRRAATSSRAASRSKSRSGTPSRSRSRTPTRKRATSPAAAPSTSRRSLRQRRS